MKKSLVVTLIALMALVCMSTAAMADPIDVRYNTSVQGGLCPQTPANFCVYNAGPNTTTYTATSASGDTVVLTYFGVGNASTPTFNDALIGPSGTSGAQFGAFNITTTGNHGAGGLSDATALLNGSIFNITINQVLPSAGTGTLVANLSGTISVTPLGAITFTFAQDHVTIGSILYQTTADSYGLNNGSGQLTSIDGTVTTPEPASLALLGSGLLGVAGTIRRKLKA